MADKSYKRHERLVAKLLGGQRQPNIGLSQEDVSHPLFSIQVKHRNSMPKWFLDALAQARRDSSESKIPLVVFCMSKRGRRIERFFVLEEEFWFDLRGSLGKQ